jgi:hypothetical protein
MLSITREDFRKIYEGLPILEMEDLFYTKPKNDAELFSRYFLSKLWRLNNIYSIVNKQGKKVRFVMNRSQHLVYAAALRHPRIIILKSRQQGISTFWLISFFDDALTRPDFSIGLMAQGQDEAAVLLERVKKLWLDLHTDIKTYLNVNLETDNTKAISFSSRSVIFIRTSFRSATLQRLHISEMGKIANNSPKKAKETKSGSLQAVAQGLLAVIESTAEGDNMFKDMWDNAVTYSGNLSPKDFYPVFLSWLGDPDCIVETDQPINSVHEKYFNELEEELGYKLTRQQKNFWIVQYRELGEKIFEEYPATPVEAFMATKEGHYYSKLYLQYVVGLNREVDQLYDKNLAVQLAVDLGMNDTNVLIPFQYYTEEFRVFDEFADTGQPIKYYCDWIKRRHWFHNLEHVILPHDAEVRELTSGKTRLQVFEEELATDLDGNPTNITFTVLPRTESVNEDIDKVRTAITKLWIAKVCTYVKKCLLNYTKEWNEKKEVWRDKPYHDEHSNGADAIRQMVIGVDTSTQFKRRKTRSNNDDILVRIGNRGISGERGMDI